MTAYPKADNRYPVLRIIAVIFMGIGTVLLVVGALLLAFGLETLLAGSMSTPPRGGDPIAARPTIVVPLAHGLGGVMLTLWSFGCLVSGLHFLAMGILFRLAIHAEGNTRAAAQNLETIRSRMESRVENIGPLFRS